MRVLIVCGSADLAGTTAEMCRVAAEAVLEAGSEPEVVFPGTMEIGHCTGCGSCRSGACSISDDMSEVICSLDRSDLLILASPIHFSGPSSLIKTVIDRLQPYWYRKKGHGGGMAALLCGGSPEPRFHCAVYSMRALSITLGTEWRGHLEIPWTDREGFSLPEDQVKEFVRGLIGS
ncbi:MAG: flavodoxin family protein [Candidatus Methanomethylophilaceae archaeon]|nr:flavodoxin family protein [Candidatus Methanomethylophilaceae archaeon]